MASKQLLIIALLLITSYVLSQVTDVRVKPFLTSNAAESAWVQLDNEGNLVIAAIIQPGVLATLGNLTMSASTTSDLVVLKCDKSMEIVFWFKRISEITTITAFHVDSHVNDIYIAGVSSANFVNIPPLYSITLDALPYFFLMLDPMGEPVWYNYVASTSPEIHLNHIEVASNGVVALVGRLRGTAYTRSGVTKSGYTNVPSGRMLGEGSHDYGVVIQYDKNGDDVYTNSNGASYYSDEFNTGVVFDSNSTCYVAMVGRRYTAYNQPLENTISYVFTPGSRTFVMDVRSSNSNTNIGTIGIDQNDNIYAVVTAGAGELNVTGYTIQRYSESYQTNQVASIVRKQLTEPGKFLIKFHISTGMIHYVHPIPEHLLHFAVTSDGEIYFCKDGRVTKYSRIGNFEWDSLFITGDFHSTGTRCNYRNGDISVGGYFQGNITTSFGQNLTSFTGSNDGLVGKIQVTSSNPIQKTCSSGMVCAEACCEWKPIGAPSFVQTCYTTDIYRCSADQADSSKKCLCPVGTDCCNGACFNSSVHVCSNGSLCPAGTTRCGQSCFRPDQYRCCNGNVIVAVGQSC